jgi:Mce-associated membrane protein
VAPDECRSLGGRNALVLNGVASCVRRRRAPTATSDQQSATSESGPPATVVAVEPAGDGEREPELAAAPPRQDARKKLRATMIAAALIAAALGGLTGFVGYRTYEANLATRQRELFLQVGTQAAINLTTISYTEADADVARVLDSATGAFHSDFQSRAKPFVDVVKQAQSRSQGDVTAAALQSVNGDQAQVIVAVSVKTTVAGTPEQQPRGWRMRLTVQKTGDTAKVSDVEFIP